MKVLKILLFIALTLSFVQAKSNSELAKETKTYTVSVADASGKTLYILDEPAKAPTTTGISYRFPLLSITFSKRNAFLCSSESPRY